MSYLDPHTHLHKRLAGVTGVAAIHVVLAIGLVAGLTIKGIAIDERPPLIGGQFELPPPPPPEDQPTPEPRSEQPAIDPVVAPVPLIKLPTYVPIEVTDVIPDIRDPLPSPGPTLDRPTPLPPSPTPSFVPRNAVPRNSPAGWVTTDDYPRRAITGEWEGTATYTLAIGRDGKVSDCRITRSTGHDLLDQATCRMISRRARFEPASDSGGGAVAGTFTGTISWRLPED